jgi:hypothetical protein
LKPVQFIACTSKQMLARVDVQFTTSHSFAARLRWCSQVELPSTLEAQRHGDGASPGRALFDAEREAVCTGCIVAQRGWTRCRRAATTGVAESFAPATILLAREIWAA